MKATSTKKIAPVKTEVKDNEILLNSLDNADINFDTNNFQEYLNTMPFMDSHKYALCVGYSYSISSSIEH